MYFCVYFYVFPGATCESTICSLLTRHNVKAIAVESREHNFKMQARLGFKCHEDQLRAGKVLKSIAQFSISSLPITNDVCSDLSVTLVDEVGMPRLAQRSKADFIRRVYDIIDESNSLTYPVSRSIQFGPVHYSSGKELELHKNGEADLLFASCALTFATKVSADNFALVLLACGKYCPCSFCI
jgi:hypothetical protein